MASRTRRNILKGLGTVSFGAAAFTLDALFGDDARTKLRELLIREDWNNEILSRKSPIDAENSKLLGKLIGYRKDRTVMLAGGREHFRHPGVMHHDNEWAASTILSVFRGLEPEVTRVDKIRELAAKGSYVLPGSPVSNHRAAEIMEYAQIDPEKPENGFRRINNPHLKLPITFEMNSEWLISKNMVVKNTIDDEKTPQWGLRIKGELLKTKQGEKDYLVISRLPNWKYASLEYKDDEIPVVLCLGGCTGAGTSAVSMLPFSGDLLRRLDELTDRYIYWQAVIEINSISSRYHPIKRDNRFQSE